MSLSGFPVSLEAAKMKTLSCGAGIVRFPTLLFVCPQRIGKQETNRTKFTCQSITSIKILLR